MGRCLITFLVLAGCSDYELDNKDDRPTDAADTDTDTDTDVDTDIEVVSCDDFDFSTWEWFGGPTFGTQPDPTDGGGLPFYDPAFDDAGYVPQNLPDQSIPVGFDRTYRAHFDLGELPPTLLLDMQSDDGIWVWLNGQAVGHWGGDWQQEGCVNENAQCVITETVAPVDATSFLQVGTNTMAARLSNPILNSWFEIVPSCD